jgi:hypothetical protein
MSIWVEVNGSKIEKFFFDENVNEAKSYNWIKTPVASLSGHAHCIICGITIELRPSFPIYAYKSKGGCVCSYCYDHFMKSGDK